MEEGSGENDEEESDGKYLHQVSVSSSVEGRGPDVRTTTQ